MSDHQLRDWRAVHRHHPNLLLEGQESALEATLVALSADFWTAASIWPDVPATLCAPSATGTVIVRNVDRFNSTDLTVLNAWLDASSHRVQVVTTSSVSLFDLVERKRFPADLYYRLNVVRIQAV